jgi:hypothetical protein
MLPQDGANDAQAFGSQYKNAFLCVKFAFVCLTNECVHVVLIGEFDVLSLIGKGSAFANSQLLLNVREIQLKPPLVLTSATTLTPSAAVTA